MVLPTFRRAVETMNPKRDRIRIEIYPASGNGESDGLRRQAADEAVVALARLIGRQIAREQFQRRMALERKALARAKAAASSKV
ncbi:MAG: hypothetical protein NVV74_03690 [Magnetospirillum sp.]|nr:hypothetical protein [Magnetospirillum sp.]